MKSQLARVRVARASAALVEKGYLWVYRDRVAAPVDLEPGALVQVEDAQGHVLGTAYFSNRSKIALRMFTRGPAITDETLLWRERIDRARTLRDQLRPVRQARRLVYSESDGLPGVIVDQYGDALVVQTLTQAAEQRQTLLIELLDELIRPRQIVVRNDVRVRELEGLTMERKAARGEPPFEVEIESGPVKQIVNLWDGQKTGSFLDQQENHAFVGQIARGRVLDLFTYGGGFALHAAPAAEKVVGVDSSETALAWAQESARRSGFENVEWVCENVFDYLRKARGEGLQYNTIILDPPAFAKRRSDLDSARQAYRDLNRRALALLAPGGVLITCSCSYNLAEEDLVGLVRQAAESTGRTLALLERRGQAQDHPEALGLPESRYLKCLVLYAVS